MPNDAAALGMRTWRIGRAAAGALGLIFAVLYLLEGRDLELGRMGAPGPGVFPLVVGILFALVSIGVITDALFTNRAGTATFPKGQDLKRLLAVVGGFVAYVLLLDVFGFLIASVVLVICFTRLVGNVSWLRAAASGVGVTLSVWAIFTLLLGVRLPNAVWN